MIEIVNVLPQLVLPNKDVLFGDTALKTGCAERHREGSGQVILAKPGIYMVSFSADLALAENCQTPGETSEVTIAVKLNGEEIPGSEMTITPSAVKKYFNVSTTQLVRMCCPCCITLSVGNSGEKPEWVKNASLVVDRRA